MSLLVSSEENPELVFAHVKRRGAQGWLQVRRGAGKDAVVRVYEDTLAGRTEPQHGHVLSLWDAA